ncbi:AAA family ATPase [Kineococcus endophyticus]|uniref:AAA family ATPase n=1 Tax=Kineococcus endophyticus TaxID=1181883 RepID=A0ABV3P2C8_9ACTN
MRTATARLWWLHGSPCAGKSVTAWELHTNLLAGEPRAYFDVDQVGMCYPEREDDPDRYALKARSARALARCLVAAGARTVVVSGVLDDASMQALRGEAVHGTDVAFCRVRVDRDELVRRLRARYGPDLAQRALDEAEDADRLDEGHLTVDSGSAPPREVAARAAELLEGARPGSPPPRVDPLPAPPPLPAPDGATAVLLVGPPGAGKSTAGFALFSTLLDDGRPSSFLDLQQVGFLADVPRPADDPGGHRLRAACVAEVWREHRAGGARALVLNGHVRTQGDVAHYRAALGDVTLTVVRLRVGRESLEDRLRERTLGLGPALAGDELVGADADEVQRTVDRALSEQRRLEDEDPADVVVDTDGVDAHAVAEEIAALLGGEPAEDG